MSEWVYDYLVMPNWIQFFNVQYKLLLKGWSQIEVVKVCIVYVTPRYNRLVMTGMRSIAPDVFQTSRSPPLLRCVVLFLGNGPNEVDFVWTWPGARSSRKKRFGRSTWVGLCAWTFSSFVTEFRCDSFSPGTALFNQFPQNTMSL